MIKTEWSSLGGFTKIEQYCKRLAFSTVEVQVYKRMARRALSRLATGYLEARLVHAPDLQNPAIISA